MSRGCWLPRNLAIIDPSMLSETFVFVPSYNHAPFIEQCLRSIFVQSKSPRKLLVIDDGSKDDSPAIIEKTLKDCPFDSELIVRENRGLCRTLNEGFALSGGDYFAYVGSDDLWLPSFLEARSALLEERPMAVLAYGHAYLVNDENEVYDSTADHVDSWANYSDGDARSMLLTGSSPISSTVMYRRSALENRSWNQDSRLEDYEMYLRLVSDGEFAFDPKVLSAWRLHGYNTSSDMSMMLSEVVETQERFFPALGTSRKALNSIQAKTKFRYARIMLQQGKKKAALGLLAANWRRGGTPAEIAKALVLLTLPVSANMAYQKYKRNRKTRRFPVLEI